MTAALAIRYVDPIDVLAIRADAKAYLWSVGEYELQEAVDALQHAAEIDGLIERCGQATVQAIIADAFRPYREATA